MKTLVVLLLLILTPALNSKVKQIGENLFLI